MTDTDMPSVPQYKPGCRVYRWVLTGHDRGFDIQEIMPLTVVRVNRKTVTVRTDRGNVVRIPPQDIAGKWNAP